MGKATVYLDERKYIPTINPYTYPKALRQLWVSEKGNDQLGDGTKRKPWASLYHAYTHIYNWWDRYGGEGYTDPSFNILIVGNVKTSVVNIERKINLIGYDIKSRLTFELMMENDGSPEGPLEPDNNNTIIKNLTLSGTINIGLGGRIYNSNLIFDDVLFHLYNDSILDRSTIKLNGIYDSISFYGCELAIPEGQKLHIYAPRIGTIESFDNVNNPIFYAPKKQLK